MRCNRANLLYRSFKKCVSGVYTAVLNVLLKKKTFECETVARKRFNILVVLFCWLEFSVRRISQFILFF